MRREPVVGPERPVHLQRVGEQEDAVKSPQ